MKITQLTKAQTTAQAEFAQRWTDIGLSTEPTDRPRAEAGIRLAYEAAGIKPPARIVWCQSPMSGALTRAIIKAQGDEIGDSVRDSVRASVRDSVWASVRASVRDSVRASVRDSVWASVRDSVWASVRDSVGDSVWASVRASVRDSVRASVRDSVWASVRDSVGDSVWDSVRASVRASVWDSVWASVRDSVGDSVWASVRASVWDSVWDAAYGQHDANWLAFYAFFAEQCGLVATTERLRGLWEVAQSAGWFWPCENICWITDRPHTLKRDDQGRLHCADGAALQYPDGWGIWAVHGVRVPAWIIEHPGDMTADKIDAEQNAEVRRVMMERFGLDRYLTEGGAKQLHADDWGTLYRKEVPGDEALVMVKVVNSTPEPDGHFKDYFLRVHPDLRPLHQDGSMGSPQGCTALNAIASTFGMTGKEYSQRLVAQT